MIATSPAVLLLELWMLVVVLDVLLAWFQPAARWPRRFTHLITEPPQQALRALLRWIPTAGWDLSAVAMLLLLGLLRVWMVRA